MPLPAGHILWLKADAGVLDASGNPCTDGVLAKTWADQDGNTNAVQATNLDQPTFHTNIQNGLPGLFFGAAPIGMATALNLVSPYSIFFVELPTTGGNTRSLASGSTNSLLSTARQDGNAVFVGALVSGTFLPVSANQVSLRIQSGSPQSSYFGNGVDLTQHATVNNDWGIFDMGASGMFGEPALSYLLEIVVYPTRVSDITRQAVESYFNAKWGTSGGGLPPSVRRSNIQKFWRN